MTPLPLNKGEPYGRLAHYWIGGLDHFLLCWDGFWNKYYSLRWKRHLSQGLNLKARLVASPGISNKFLCINF